MFDTKRHNEIIDELKKITVQKKEVSKAILKQVSVNGVLIAGEQAKKKMLVSFVALMSPLMKQSKKLGNDFKQEKLATRS